MSRATPVELDDSDWLSQVGKRRADGTWSFPNRLRTFRQPPEHDLSMVLGRLSAREVRLAAYGSWTGLTPKKDAVRHVLVGTLKDAGFRVEHTPRWPGSPLHVSVFWDGEEGWDDRVAGLLDACCGGGKIDE